VTAKIQTRRDTSANWSSNNPILSVGEMGYDTTDKKIKVGDGVTAWNSLEYIAGGGGLENEGTQRTSGFTAETGNEYFLKTDAGAFEVELPPIAAGNKVKLIDSTGFWSTNSPTVVNNGTAGFNGGDALELNVGGSWIEFSANIDDSQWEVSGPTQLDEFSATVPVVTAWESFTPEFLGQTSWNPGNATIEGRKRRVGDSLEVQVSMIWGSTTSLAGDLYYDLPDALEASTVGQGSTAALLGDAFYFDQTASQQYDGGVTTLSGTNTIIFVHTSTTGSSVDNNVPFTWDTGDLLRFSASIPIEGWEVTQVAGVIGEATSTEAGLLSRYQESTGSLDNQFDSGTWNATRIGNVVTLSISEPAWTSQTNPATSDGVLPADFLPADFAYNLAYSNATAWIVEISGSTTANAGRIRFLLRSPTNLNSNPGATSQTNADRTISISYNV